MKVSFHVLQQQLVHVGRLREQSCGRFDPVKHLQTRWLCRNPAVSEAEEEVAAGVRVPAAVPVRARQQRPRFHTASLKNQCGGDKATTSFSYYCRTSFPIQCGLL